MLKDIISKDVIKVCVHNGVFHADDVCSVMLIKLLNKNVDVTRTRDEKEISSCNVIVDVCGEYNPVECKFDHHQKDFDVKRSNGTHYASCGLIWKEIGKDICSKYIQSEYVDTLYNMIDEKLINGIDAIDNGEYKFDANDIQLMSINSCISYFNVKDINSRLQDIKFNEAVLWMHTFFENFITSCSENVVQFETVHRQMEEQKGSEIFVMREYGPWTSVFKKFYDEYKSFKLVVYKDVTTNGVWRIQTTPSDIEDAFSMSCPAPSYLAGYREDAEHKTLGGCPIVFVHRGRFIGGFKAISEEQIIQCAKKWINLSD